MLCAQYRYLSHVHISAVVMLSRKPGPPVPPRPKPSTIPHKYISPQERTIIYKSPVQIINSNSRQLNVDNISTVIENNINNQHNDIVNSNLNNTATTRTHHHYQQQEQQQQHQQYQQQPYTHRHIGNTNNSSNVNVENQISNSEIIKMETMVFADNNHKSPIAKPRQNTPSKKMLNLNNRNEASMVKQLLSNSGSINDDVAVYNHDHIYQPILPPPSEQCNVNEKHTHKQIHIIECIPSTLAASSVNNIDSNENTDKLCITAMLDSNNAPRTEIKSEQLPKFYQTTKCLQLKLPTPTTTNSVISPHAGVLSVDNNSECNLLNSSCTNGHSSKVEKKVTFHEMLISELTAMRKVELPKKRRKRSLSSSVLTDNLQKATSCTALHSDVCYENVNNDDKMKELCISSMDDSGLEDDDRTDEVPVYKSNHIDWDRIKKIEKR